MEEHAILFKLLAVLLVELLQSRRLLRLKRLGRWERLVCLHATVDAVRDGAELGIACLDDHGAIGSLSQSDRVHLNDRIV